MAGQPRRGFVLAAALMAIFTAAIEATIVATAMPTILADLGGFHLLTWVFAAYLLAQTATIPVFGRLSDLYGRKPNFFVGVGIFLVGSILCGFAQGMVSLIAFRLVQGLGSGAIGPVTSTIIGDIYGPEERPRIQGWLWSVWGGSAVAGPVLGGFIVEHAHWALVFWINVPVCIAAVVLLAVFMREHPQRKRHQVDFKGSILLMVSVSMLVIAVTQFTSLSSTAVAIMVTISLAVLIVFIVHECRTREPILPFAIWQNPLIRTGNGVALMMGAILMSISAFMPTYVQGVMGRSSTIAGLVIGCVSLCWTLGSFASGRIMIRTSYRVTAILAGILMVVGSILLILLTPDRGAVWAGVGCALVGFGLGFANTTYLVALQASVGWGERGVATSSNLFARLLGQSLGAAVFGAILNYGLHRQILSGGVSVERLMDHDLRQTLDPTEAESLIGALAHALHNVYLASGLFAVIVLLLAFGVPLGLNPRSQREAAERATASDGGLREADKRR